MAKHWPKVCEIVEALSYIVKGTDNNGIDLYFMVSEVIRKDIKKTTSLVKIVQNVKVEIERTQPTSDINVRLSRILDDYKTSLDNRHWWNRKPKPLSLYVLTDGIWEEEVNPEEPIRNAAEKLEQLKKDSQQIGIQFISFGSDVDGLRKLRELDDGRSFPYGFPK